MSRSHKKIPIIYWAWTSRNAQKEWKKQCRRKFRRIPVNKDVPNGGKYKIISGDIWTSPSDGKQYYPKDKKSWRK